MCTFYDWASPQDLKDTDRLFHPACEGITLCRQYREDVAFCRQYREHIDQIRRAIHGTYRSD